MISKTIGVKPTLLTDSAVPDTPFVLYGDALQFYSLQYNNHYIIEPSCHVKRE